MGSIGIGVGTSVPVTGTARINTLSAYDLAYWASTFVAKGIPSQYVDRGPETDSVPLIVWAASQVGVTVPDTLTALKAALTDSTTVDGALRIRGAVLVRDAQLAVCLGMGDIIDIVNGRYFIRRLNSIDKEKWTYGAKLPGVIY